ncbi:hypothetical protein, partial [Klebsiella variicola]|uniref:hypothetical protein n=1 Tax=Klebsiella variicola TaxID=244366 RepID=UPI0027665480|nr:cation transporter [Klebsiella variicola]
TVEAELAKRFDIQHATIAIDWPDMPHDEGEIGQQTASALADHETDGNHAGHDHSHAGHKH